MTYGDINPVHGGAEPIDQTIRYRVVIAVTKPPASSDTPHHDLVRVARLPV